MNEATLHIKKLPPEQWKDWDTFVLQQRDGTLFHSSIWLEEQPGMELEIYGLFLGDTLMGGAPVCIKKKMGIRILPQPLLTHYYGPVLSDDLLLMGELTTAVKLLLSQVYERFDAYSFSIPPQAKQLRETLLQLPFHRENQRSVTNLRSNRKAEIEPDQLIASYSRSSRRNEIRTAMRKGVEASVSTDWSTIFDLTEKSFLTAGRPHPLSKDSFTALASKLHSFGLCTGVIAYAPDKTPIAATWATSDQHTMYNVLSGVDQNYRKLNGGPVALHECLRNCMERKLIFDFCGSMMGRINSYMQSYGTQECWNTHFRSVESARFGFLRNIGIAKF